MNVYTPNITETEKMIIETLSLNGVPMTPYQIKEQIDRSYAGVAKMCKQLEERGFFISKRSETIRKSVKIEYWFTVSGGYLALKLAYEKSLEYHVIKNMDDDREGNEFENMISSDDRYGYYSLNNCDKILLILTKFANMDVIYLIMLNTFQRFLSLMPNELDKTQNLIWLFEPFIRSIDSVLQNSEEDKSYVLLNSPFMKNIFPRYIFTEILDSFKYQRKIILSDGSILNPLEIVLDEYKKNYTDWDDLKKEYFLKFKASSEKLYLKMSVFEKNELIDWWQEYRKRIDDYLNT